MVISIVVAVVEGVTQEGARVVPLDFKNCPAVPFANKAVVFTAVWYGIDPPKPPAIFVALVAVPLKVVAVKALVEGEYDNPVVSTLTDF